MERTKKWGFSTFLCTILPSILIMISCGETKNSGLDSTYDRLNQARDFWEDNAYYCHGEFPAKRNDDGSCDDGDMTLFNALLCASGEQRGCDAARDAQSADGRWWRSPRRARGEGRRPNNSFSRDMSMGVLLYLAVTKDRDAASQWLRWIDKNRPCVLEKPFGLGCQIRGPERFCRNEDNQVCTLTPGSWAIMKEVWEYLELPLHSKMKSRATQIAGNVLVQETELTDPGYELHLKAVSVYLKQKMNIRHTQRRAMNKVLIEKQPHNPFMQYLNDGPSEALLKRTLDRCPTYGRYSNRLRQWSWERDTNEQAWKNSMLWDCIFLTNILVAL